MRVLVVAVLASMMTMAACGAEISDAPLVSPDTGNIRDHADNASVPLPHQDVPGFYSWDGDEWVFNPTPTPLPF